MDKDKFKGAVLELIANSTMRHPNSDRKQPITLAQISVLDDRLSRVVSQIHTPDHPPYAAMIERAILELDQKWGSTEDSISEFIKREYGDLPWAHRSLLKHHLGLLCESGELLVTRGSGYSLPGVVSGLGSVKGQKKRRRKRCSRTKQRKMIVVKSQKVIEALSQVDDHHFHLAGRDVKKSDHGHMERVQQLEQEAEGGALVQLTDSGENGLDCELTAKSISPLPLVRHGAFEYQEEVGKRKDKAQLKLSSLSNPNAQKQQVMNPGEDVIFEPLSRPGFKSIPVGDISDNQEKHRNAVPRSVTEKLGKDNSSYSVKQQQEPKLKHRGSDKQFEEQIKQREVVLALPHLQKGNQLLGGTEQLQKKLPLVLISERSQQLQKRRHSRKRRKTKKKNMLTNVSMDVEEIKPQCVMEHSESRG